MAASSLPPEEQRVVRPFDPLNLDRTIIALPLLRRMQEDLARIAAFAAAHPGAADQYDAVIQWNLAFGGGPFAARERVLAMLQDANDAALAAARLWRDRADDAARPAEQQRIDALEAAIRDAVIEPVLSPAEPYSLARLHAAVIRRLLLANERLGPDGSAGRPITRVHPERFEVVIDLNLDYRGGRAAARQWILDNLEEARRRAGVRDAGQEIHTGKGSPTSQYLFARLEARVIQELVGMDTEHAKVEAAQRRQETDNAALRGQIDVAHHRAIYHVWPDFEVSATINKSVATIKADAAQKSFSAFGEGISWAVMDSGIRQDHPHFRLHGNIDPTSTLHRDFTLDGGNPLDDPNGHGTHVAGIIAGEWPVPAGAPEEQWPVAVSRYLKQDTDDVEYQAMRLPGISGMAPRCRLVSLRVLDDTGKGSVSNLIAAIEHIQEINGYGRRLLIHGVNMSLGYTFEPEWFACGQSPLCVEVDRLVRSGVVVVVAAGNTGYGTVKADAGATAAGLALTINDPGNADLAITVGATHRESPYRYGVSYFSSKGPTGDGRMKPDLVAPGEKIISCAAGQLRDEGAKGQPCDYVETSGTSMAAPHVSGAIAAFLSVRTEFVGLSERVKEIFVSSASDLRRDRYFQGAGLVDLMRAIQSV